MAVSDQREILKTTLNDDHFGMHLTLEGYGASPDKIADQHYILSWLRKFPYEIGMHKIAEPMVREVGAKNRKDPGGISGFVLIAESHISIHTFPLRGFLTADVYTCQNDLDAFAIETKFRHAFELEEIETQIIKRGLRYPKYNIHAVDSDTSRTHRAATP